MKFKTRNKIDTSNNNMLRNEKRERLLGLIIAAGQIFNDPNKKTISMEISTYKKEQDVINWELELLQKTKWINTDFVNIQNDKFTITQNKNIKLRIYHKWLYTDQKNKSIKKVLKYMYSPLFVAFLLIHRGVLYNNCINLNVSDFNTLDILLLQKWFEKIFTISSSIFNRNDNSKKIMIFNQYDSLFILNICESIIFNIPSERNRLYLTQGGMNG